MQHDFAFSEAHNDTTVFIILKIGGGGKWFLTETDKMSVIDKMSGRLEAGEGAAPLVFSRILWYHLHLSINWSDMTFLWRDHP